MASSPTSASQPVERVVAGAAVGARFEVRVALRADVAAYGRATTARERGVVQVPPAPQATKK